LFTWRREARKAAERLPVFVLAVIERPGSEASEEPPRRGQRRGRPRAPAIELEACGIKVRIACGRVMRRVNWKVLMRECQAIGRSRGGRTTKIHALTDCECRPIAFMLTGGQVADCTAGAASQPP